MAKQVKGVVRNYQVPGSDMQGYRPVWEMGRTSYCKRRQRVNGVNRPST